MTPMRALEHAVLIANMSPCAKSKRGVVVFDRERFDVIARGCNHPMIGACGGNEACRSVCNKICIHAEHNALSRCLDFHICDREMLHVKVVDGHAVPSGPPSCVECSKAIFASGIIRRMWLLHEIGHIPMDALATGETVVISDTLALVSYGVELFHRLSLAYHHLPVFEGP